jgi:hypothetical protein
VDAVGVGGYPSRRKGLGFRGLHGGKDSLASCEQSPVGMEAAELLNEKARESRFRRVAHRAGAARAVYGAWTTATAFTVLAIALREVARSLARRRRRGKGKGSEAAITENVKAGDLPKLVVFVSRDLTQRRGCTMRNLRTVRRL